MILATKTTANVPPSRKHGNALALASEGEPLITLGTDPQTGVPFRIPRRLLHEKNIRYCGRPGCWKTSSMFSLLLQLMQTAPEPETFIYWDLAGAQNQYHGLRLWAESLGYRFRLLSLNPEDDSDVVGFFDDVPRHRDAVGMISNILLSALNIEHGTGHGQSYFAARCYQQAGLGVTPWLAETPPDRPLDLGDLDRLLNRRGSRIRDGDHVRSAIKALAEYSQFRPALDERPDRRISFSNALEHGRELIYLHMPGLTHSVSLQGATGLTMFAVQQAAANLMRAGKKSRTCWCFFDEAAEATSRSFARWLAHVRKFSINAMLSYQTGALLANRDLAVNEVISATTEIALLFSASTRDEIDELQTLSRTAKKTLRGWATSSGSGSSCGSSSSASMHGDIPGSSTGSSASWSQWSGRSDSEAEHILPQLEHNEILEVDATPGRFFLVVRSSPDGHFQPLALDGLRLIHGDLHHQLQTLPLPARAAPAAPAPLTVERDPMVQSKLAALAAEITAALGLEDLPRS